jgi:hypothetical protein
VLKDIKVNHAVSNSHGPVAMPRIDKLPTLQETGEELLAHWNTCGFMVISICAELLQEFGDLALLHLGQIGETGVPRFSDR